MFTLDSLHITSLSLAIVIVILFMLSYIGYAKNGKQFFLILAIFPYMLATFSQILPFETIYWCNYIFYSLGLILGLRKIKNIKWDFNVVDFDREEKVLLALVVIQLLSTLMASTVLHGEGAVIDAMTYHVGAAKEWVLYMNGPHLNTNNPESFTASYYEYFQYSFMLVMRPVWKSIINIEKTHFEFLAYTLLLAAQIFTTLFAVVYIPMLLNKIFKNNKKFVMLIILLLLGMKNMTWIWRTAKNDAYPLYCALLCCYIIVDNFSLLNTKKIFLAFLVLGIGIGAKFTNVYAMIFVLLYIIIKNHKIYSLSIWKKYIVIAGLGGIAGLLPILIRNYVETGNPFYPTSSSVFPNVYLSDKTEMFHHLYSHATSWIHALSKLKSLFIANPLMIFMICFCIYLKRYYEAIAFLIFIVVVAKITGERFMWRQMSILLLFVIILFKNLYDEMKLRGYFKKKYASLAGVIFILLVGQLKPERLVKYPKNYYFKKANLLVKNQYYAWDELLRENIENYKDKKATTDHTPYFSRLAPLILGDTRKEFRYDY